jgi:hypothetical protein
VEAVAEKQRLEMYAVFRSLVYTAIRCPNYLTLAAICGMIETLTGRPFEMPVEKTGRE